MASCGPVCLSSKEGGVWWAWTCNCSQQVLLMKNSDKCVHSLQSGLRTRYNWAILQFPEVPNLSQHIAYCLLKVSVCWQQTLRLNHRKAVHWAGMNLCHLVPIRSSIPISARKKKSNSMWTNVWQVVLAAAAVWHNAEHSCDAFVEVFYVGLKFPDWWQQGPEFSDCR